MSPIIFLRTAPSPRPLVLSLADSDTRCLYNLSSLSASKILPHCAHFPWVLSFSTVSDDYRLLFPWTLLKIKPQRIWIKMSLFWGRKKIFLNQRPRDFLEVLCKLILPPFPKQKNRKTELCFCCWFIYHVSQSLNRQRFSLHYSIFNSLRFVNFLNSILFLPHHLCWHVYLFLIFSPWFVSYQALLGDLYKYRFYILKRLEEINSLKTTALGVLFDSASFSSFWSYKRQRFE